MWRSLYSCPDVVFVRKPLGEIGAISDDGRFQTIEKQICWRDPDIPAALGISVDTATQVTNRDTCSNGSGDDTVSSRDLECPCSAASSSSRGANSKDPENCTSQSSLDARVTWMISVRAGVQARFLTFSDFLNSGEEYERRVSEVPFQILQNVAHHRESGTTFGKYNSAECLLC